MAVVSDRMAASMVKQGITPSNGNTLPTPITSQNKAIQNAGSPNNFVSSNPKDATNYVPGSLPGDHLNQDPTPVDTSQPSPQSVTTQPTATGTQVTTNPTNPSTTAPGLPGMANLSGTQSQQAGQAIDQLKQKYGTALHTLNASGQASPSDMGAATSGVTTALGTQPPPSTPAPTTTPAVDNYYNPETNPAIAETSQQIMDFISPQATRDDLTAQMSKLMKDQTELSADKLQLMNIKNVMSGTADDLRNEITAAGGFATDSQVQALAVARNSTLLKQATLLQDTVQSQQDQVANDTTLLNFEKDMANTQASQRMGVLQYQRENYQYNQTAQRTSLSEMQKTEGWNGIYAAALASGDPNAIAHINTVMGQGFDLATAAKNDTTTAQNALDLKAKQVSIINTQANTANTIANTQKTQQDARESSGLPNPSKAGSSGYTDTGIKYTNAVGAKEIEALIKQEGLTGTKNQLAPNDYNRLKSSWVRNGLKDTDFDSIFGAMRDPNIMSDSKKKVVYN